MKPSFSCSALLTVTLAASLVSGTALGAISDYRFELANTLAAGAGKTDVTLRLAHIPDGKSVPGAVIFQPKAVMAGMENMPAAATVEPGNQPGTYVLHVATSMAGPWTLQLSAKVQGESGTLTASVPFQAAE